MDLENNEVFRFNRLAVAQGQRMSRHGQGIDISPDIDNRKPLTGINERGRYQGLINKALKSVIATWHLR